MPEKPFPAHDFITIRDTFNRWRAAHAPHLSRDEAIRFALGEWLMQKGYLPAVISERPAPDAAKLVPPSELE